MDTEPKVYDDDDDDDDIATRPIGLRYIKHASHSGIFKTGLALPETH